jgi:hypothetical protein
MTSIDHLSKLKCVTFAQIKVLFQDLIFLSSLFTDKWVKAAENAGCEPKTKLRYLVWNRRKSAKFLMMFAYFCTCYLF